MSKIKFLFAIICIIFSANCSAQIIENENAYKIRFMPFNTTQAEYSPIFYKDGLLFCSNRETNMSISYASQYTNQPMVDIFFTTTITADKWKTRSFNKNINSNYSEGAASLTKAQDKIYFTRNDVKGDFSQLNIYYSTLKDNNWTEAKPHPVNSTKYSSGHPAISPSGNFIIYASNMPGGFGGTDLYISYLKSDKWTKPLNLGSTINTKGNEISPFILENNQLYFASNGLRGEGGYDIYSAYYDQFEWKGLKNIGYPFNTQYDDFGFIINSNKNFGYFNSNRLNGGEDDDIYSFSKYDVQFNNCDTIKNQDLCRTFFEEGTMPTESLPLIYEWNFGDGNKKKGSEVRHCFAKAGKYTIQLNIVDLITDQVFINEATYEFEIEPIKIPFFVSADTFLIGKEYNFESIILASNTKSHTWDFGDGHIVNGIKQVHQFQYAGNLDIKLNIVAPDSTGIDKSQCMIKPIIVLANLPTSNSVKQTDVTKTSASDISKVIYSIKDSKGFEYKIQLATSKTSIKERFKKLEGILNVEEYFDRKVFGYTSGSFNNAIDAYPTLKKIRGVGFKEAVLIAMKDGKVVSGSDSSFFVNINKDVIPVKIINVSGKILDKDNNKLPALLNWESLGEDSELGNMICNNPIGEYSFNVLDGDVYGYFATFAGYYTSSYHIDLTKQNDVSDIISNIVLFKIEDLVKNGTSLKINNLFFESEKFKIEPISHLELERISDFIQNNTNYLYEIGGHSDHQGGSSYNYILSQKRANAVLNNLVALGCPRKLLIAKGYGNTKILTTNKKLTELNRRVEIKILKFE